jgi:hypothetical protein
VNDAGVVTGAGSTPRETRVFACDVGSTRPGGGFAWATTIGNNEAVHVSADVRALVAAVSAALSAGLSVALGFEAPLFIPVPRETGRLFKARQGEPLSWSSGFGPLTMAQALHLSAWILRELLPHREAGVRFATDPRRWPPGDEQLLFCWEAFIAGTAHGDKNDPECHVRDAATALRAFTASAPRLSDASAISAEETQSVNGAAAAWSGWASPSALREPVVVLKANSPYAGRITPYV